MFQTTYMNSSLPWLADKHHMLCEIIIIFETVARRTEIFSRSFIPSAAALWNDLDMILRHLRRS